MNISTASSKLMSYKKHIVLGLVFSLLLVHTPHLCNATTNDFSALDSTSQSFVNLVFAHWVRRLCLIGGLVGGVVRYLATNSFMEFFIFFGVGFIINLGPSLIDMFTRFGGATQ